LSGDPSTVITSHRDLRVDWFSFELGTLEKALKLSSPPFVNPSKAFRQLRYVEKYAGDLQCKSLAIESHYIDRDYIEDHSVFYSKSLYPYPNSCRRIHFFSLEADAVKHRLFEIVEHAAQQGSIAYKAGCERFSEEAYLGFAVVKPLAGSPVGRTVLRCFPELPTEPERAGQFRRNFRCTRVYKCHLAGAELSVCGLAFQQQDVGVSACATTAIWSALQKAGDHEDIAPATPAQITMLATRHSLPGGRPMPSEGLSVDQMCQAVQAVGVAPNLFRVEDVNLARGLLHSAINSGFAPVLILESQIGRHAVAVVGMKVKPRHEVLSIAVNTDDAASDLLGLYIHDDRLGPYLRADLASKDVQRWNRWTRRLDQKKVLHVVIPERSLHEEPEVKQAWELTHILIPMHSKIRLSLAGLRHVASEVVKATLTYSDTFQIPQSDIPGPTVTFNTWIVRAHKYVESLFLSSGSLKPDRVARISTTISLARYVGVVRISSQYFDPIDVVIDTTSTTRNIHSLGIIVPVTELAHTEWMSQYLAKVFGCPLVA
jgi:hypothetical protein